METVTELALLLDGRLARYEPLALIVVPLPTLLVARLVHAATSAVAYRGLIAVAAIKTAPPAAHSSFLLCCLITHAVTLASGMH